MAEKSKQTRISGWLQIIQTVKTPLAFFVLTLLVVEALLASLVVKASGRDQTIAIVGMLVLLVGACAAVFFLAYRRPTSLATTSIQGVTTRASRFLSFDSVMSEISMTIERLEQEPDRIEHYRNQNDLCRLLDGLYSALLYASSAVPTGQIEAIFYGNLMEWDKATESLKVRYFKGPYNDEIMTRTFPLRGPKQGVASVAVQSGKIQIRNSMEAELKERDEARLRAMMSVPVPRPEGHDIEPNSIVVANIDSVVEGVFPDIGSDQYESVRRRAQEVVKYVQRVNTLRNLK